MNYEQAKIFFHTIIILLVLTVLWLIFRPSGKTVIADSEAPKAESPATETARKSTPTPLKKESIPSLHISQRVGNLSKQFADLNPEHLAYAQALGINPISRTADIMKINRPIVRIESSELYHLDNLSHSYPYLVPEAAELLDSIGTRFNRELRQRGGGHYRIKLTSLLRTRESVNRLRHGNVNSTENSAHLYGTTFDISYVDFHESAFNTHKNNDGELKNLLAEVLLQLRDEGRCLVKFERKQGCFHITATGHR